MANDYRIGILVSSAFQETTTEGDGHLIHHGGIQQMRFAEPPLPLDDQEPDGENENSSGNQGRKRVGPGGSHLRLQDMFNQGEGDGSNRGEDGDPSEAFHGAIDNLRRQFERCQSGTLECVGGCALDLQHPITPCAIHRRIFARLRQLPPHLFLV